MAAVNDLFAQLLEAKWRDVAFPIETFGLTCSHDLALHAKPDVDGAQVEATGRGPREFQARIPFLNHVYPGKVESWTAGKLFPTQFTYFIAAMEDKSLGELQHPQYGTLKVKPKHYSAPLDAKVRGGIIVEASWVESTDNEAESDSLLTANPATVDAAAQGDSLDANVYKLRTKIAKPAISFGDAMRSITAVFDQATLLNRRIGGAIDQVSYHLDRLQDSVNRARDAQTWPIATAIQNLRATLFRLKTQLLVQAKDIKTYVTPGAMTIGQLAGQLQNTTRDLAELNKTLFGAPEVPRLTAVRYYVKQTALIGAPPGV